MSDTLASALVAALADLTVVEKGRTAKIKTKSGPDYSYDYAAIEDVVKLTRPLLAAHGIVALTPIHDHGNGLACTVTLVHASGETMDLGPFPFPAGRDAQSTGSAVTYHRRYALVAALGLAAGDDDDGAAATESANKPAPKAAPPQGITPAEMLDKIKTHLGNGDDEQAQGAWRHARPKAADDGLIYGAEQARVLQAVDDFAAGPADYADGEEPF